MIDYTVIITHFNRAENLSNTLKGLSRQSVLPKEVIIVEMGDMSHCKLEFEFNISVIKYPWDWKFMPLAGGRNLGAAQVTAGQLVFLDVDCIPDATSCAKLAKASSKFNALVMGTPKYLLSKLNLENDCNFLKENSVYHPARPIAFSLQQESCYELFWSLCFSIPAVLFREMEGFDENYMGYGAEDTDFALTAKNKDIRFYLSDAEVYHQQHAIYIPPLNHLQSIVRNCNYYKLKWGYWPMIDCLHDFKEMNFIKWNPFEDNSAEILRLPSEDYVNRYLVKNAPYR